jgi:hypothetical protein
MEVNMKRYLLAALAVIILLYPATASASVSGAERAVRREVKFDYDPPSLAAYCEHAGRNRYSCDIHVWDCINGEHCAGTMVEGRARVTQVGKRYRVSYRIYW